jgi:hypothetical protein
MIDKSFYFKKERNVPRESSHAAKSISQDRSKITGRH